MEEEPLPEVIKAVGPGIIKSSTKKRAYRSIAIAGLAFGGVAGTIRSSTPVLFAVASGIQFSAIGGIYWATKQTSTVWLARRQAVNAADISSTDQSRLSAASGAVTGAAVAMIFRGRANVLPGALIFSGIGYLGQTVVNRYDDRPVALKGDTPGLIERVLNSRFFPMKKLSDEEYRDMLSERLLRTEADIALIDDELAEIKRKSSVVDSIEQDT